MIIRFFSDIAQHHFRSTLNRRQVSFVKITIISFIIALALLVGNLVDGKSISIDLESRHLAPSFKHFFGTDWLGRDMFKRTMSGLALSIQVGFMGALLSCVLATSLGLIATLGKTADRIVSWLIDLFLSVPHLVALILISFAFGGGMKGIVIGVGLTHWPSLARVIRAEVMQLQVADYVRLSQQFGKTRWWIATHHMLPHIIPQLFIGVLLLFPHAILHEAAVTFIGLGLSPNEPAIGIILSESMRYLSMGMWWLALFPGLCLLIVVRSFDIVGGNLRRFIDPNRSQE